MQAILTLTGDDFKQGLRELLAGQEADSQLKLGHLEKTAFQWEARFRPVLLAFVNDPLVTGRVREVLALIGMPEDLRMITSLALPSLNAPVYHPCLACIAAELVRPDDDSEWSFLRDCVINASREGGVEIVAIQSLKLNGSPRSEAILQVAKRKNPDWSVVQDALAYVRSKPVPLEGPSLTALAKRVAPLLMKADSSRFGRPRFNESGDKALIDFTLSAPGDRSTYTATFHKANGLWVLRGVRPAVSVITIN